MNDLGHLHTIDPAALDDDPFWGVVRRRHPDAEVVLVEESAPRPAPLAPDRAHRVAAGLVDGWRVVAPLLAAAGDDGPPVLTWRARSAGHALVAQKALRSLSAEQGTELLRALALVLGRAGWLLRPTGRDGVAVLDARGGLVDLQAESGPGATVLTLATGILAVSADDRSRIRGQIEQVASWQ